MHRLTLTDLFRLILHLFGRRFLLVGNCFLFGRSNCIDFDSGFLAQRSRSFDKADVLRQFAHSRLLFSSSVTSESVVVEKKNPPRYYHEKYEDNFCDVPVRVEVDFAFLFDVSDSFHGTNGGFHAFSVVLERSVSSLFEVQGRVLLFSGINRRTSIWIQGYRIRSKNLRWSSPCCAIF